MDHHHFSSLSYELISIYNSSSSNDSRSEEEKILTTSGYNYPDVHSHNNCDELTPKTAASDDLGKKCKPDWFRELIETGKQDKLINKTGSSMGGDDDEHDLISKLNVINIENNGKDADVLMILNNNDDDDEKRFDEKKTDKKQSKSGEKIKILEQFKMSPKVVLKNYRVDNNYCKVNQLENLLNENSFLFKKADSLKSIKSENFLQDINLVEIGDDDDGYDLMDDFIIPELPKGKQIVFQLLSNWGDADYIGLNGIEIFDIESKVKFDSEQIICESSPWTSNLDLISGNHRMKDEDHVWFTNYKPYQSITIKIIFHQMIKIALIRIWNYRTANENDTCKGVRFVVIKLDDEIIFQGEIARASRDVNDLIGDAILFTIDEDILKNLAKSDEYF